MLSTPNLLTLDNEEAKIVVGQNVPFITGQFTNTGAGNGSVNPFQTIERKDVGLTLRVQPQISESGTVKLQIYQEVSSVTSDRTNRRRHHHQQARRSSPTCWSTTAQIVVLGGLMQDDVRGQRARRCRCWATSRSSAACSGTKRAARNKTNLMVFLRPVVVRDAATTDALSLDRYDYMRGMQQDAQPQPSILRADQRSADAAAAARARARPPLPAPAPPGRPVPASAGAVAAQAALRADASAHRTRAHACHPAALRLRARQRSCCWSDDGAQIALWHAAARRAAALDRGAAQVGARSLQQLDAAALAQRISAAYARASPARPRW